MSQNQPKYRSPDDHKKTIVVTIGQTDYTFTFARPQIQEMALGHYAGSEKASKLLTQSVAAKQKNELSALFDQPKHFGTPALVLGHISTTATEWNHTKVQLTDIEDPDRRIVLARLTTGQDSVEVRFSFARSDIDSMIRIISESTGGGAGIYSSNQGKLLGFLENQDDREPLKELFNSEKNMYLEAVLLPELADFLLPQSDAISIR